MQATQDKVTPPVLLCENVELRIDHKPLLSGISLALSPGKSLALVGPNGLGKTTLMRSLAGIARPYAGCVRVHGEEVWPMRNVTFEHGACYLASAPALLLDHSIAGNLEFFLNAFGHNPTWPELRAALDSVGLAGREAQVSRTLSTGQKRRLTLAGLLVLKPRLVLADEPTNGLDLDGVALCLRVFADLRRDFATAVCVASHDERLISVCDQVVELELYKPAAKAKQRFQGNVFA
jgi:ABC-type multidrug transport system ATPase subunit